MWAQLQGTVYRSRLFCTTGNNIHGPFHGRDRICSRHKGFSSSSVSAFWSNCTPFSWYLRPDPLLMLCAQRGCELHRECIRLPLFQQSAFYEWVLKIGESWPRSDVSILDVGWQLWSLVLRDRAAGVGGWWWEMWLISSPNRLLHEQPFIHPTITWNSMALWCCANVWS